MSSNIIIRAMRDYYESKIYKIINSVNEKVFIGSTTFKTLGQKLATHRSNSYRKDQTTTYSLYRAMRKLGKKKFSIILIKRYPCSSKEELVKEEERIIKTYPIDVLYNLNVKVIWDEGIRYYKLLSKIKDYTEDDNTSKEKQSTDERDSTNFKGGSLYKSVSNKYPVWVYQWYENGKPKKKSYSINKYGNEEAYRLAHQYMEAFYLK